MPRAIVLSDLHLGPDGPLAIFRDAPALVAFLSSLAQDDQPPTELILAGDIFDFLQSPDYNGFDVRLAEQRFQAIVNGPQTKHVMAALKSLAICPNHTITLLAGNHDPEMLLPGVRAMFEKEIDAVGRVRYGDDEPLWPGQDTRPPIWGHAVGTKDECVWVVHGDRWDTCNAIHRDELRRLVKEGHPVDLPVGSKLVYRVLNQLQPRPESRWIPYLKPDLVVLPLLLYLDPRVTLAFLEQHEGVTEDLFWQYVRGWLRLGSLFGETEKVPASFSSGVAPFLTALLAEGIREEYATNSQQDLALAALQEYVRYGSAPAEGTLAAHAGVRRGLLRTWLAGHRFYEQRRDTNGPDGMLEAAERWLPENVVALIAGHTHGPRTQLDRRPAYINTGTWIPVGRVHEGPMKDVLDAIERGDFQAEAPRTFAEIIWGDGPLRVIPGRCDAQGRIVREG